MDGITKELAAKAAEFYKVSEQNREVWMAGFAAGYLGGNVNALEVAKANDNYVTTVKIEWEE